jgi:general secretion pathway protein G
MRRKGEEEMKKLFADVLEAQKPSWSSFEGAKSPLLPFPPSPALPRQLGFTLIELVVTVAVLTVLTLGVVPLVKVSVKRQKEQRLREALREMRAAIDQFHREALAGQALRGQQGAGQGLQGSGGAFQGSGNQVGNQIPGSQNQGGGFIDPRIRVGIVDDKIFKTDNLDRYPPDLETLVQGVNVAPLPQSQGIIGGPGGPNATDNRLTSDKKKVYLRRIPVDPMTGEADWELRSAYDEPDGGSWGGENVFDVRSKSEETALNGEKYSDW